MTPIIRALLAFAVSLVRSRVSLQLEIFTFRCLYSGTRPRTTSYDPRRPSHSARSTARGAGHDVHPVHVIPEDALPLGAPLLKR